MIKDVGEQQEKANIEGATVAYLPPKVYRNGTMTFEHDFKDAGRYVGIVTVTDDLGRLSSVGRNARAACVAATLTPY